VVLSILGRHRGETVVVVGHRDTVPAIAARLTGGKFEAPVAEGEFDALYVLSLPRFGPAAMLRLRY
jgi:broad specificity phosphatase PhoE